MIFRNPYTTIMYSQMYEATIYSKSSPRLPEFEFMVTRLFSLQAVRFLQLVPKARHAVDARRVTKLERRLKKANRKWMWANLKWFFVRFGRDNRFVWKYHRRRTVDRVPYKHYLTSRCFQETDRWSGFGIGQWVLADAAAPRPRGLTGPTGYCIIVLLYIVHYAVAYV